MEQNRGLDRINSMGTDTELLERAKALAKRYRDSIADLVAVIAEVERGRLYAAAGYSSLFDYCVKELLLSEDDAYKMARSARAARERPEILSFLAEGSLTARSLSLLAPERRCDDFVELLDRAKGQTVKQVEKIIAGRHPEKLPRETIRTVGAPLSAAVVEATALGVPPPVVYRIGFCADEALKAMIDRATGLLRHRLPEGKFEDVLREALTCLLSDLDPLQGEAAAARPGARSNPHARQVPPSVRDEVWRRDGGRCAFVADGGRRCEATAWLELDHVQPWALGGRSDDAANLRLLCRAHNQWEARRRFGARAAPNA